MSLHEDFDSLKKINRQLVKTNFIPEWNFKLEIPGAPKDFDFYVKSITYGIVDIATDEAKIGAASYAWPIGSNIHRCSFVVRDNADGRIQLFFAQWKQLVVTGDGTVRVPFAANGYLKEVTMCEVSIDGKATPHWRHKMYPTTVGEASRSRDNGNFFEIPVTLTEFSSM